MEIPGSTELQPPWLGPTLPEWPQLPEVARVYAAALVGTNVYPAYVQQWAPPLSLRDRIPCYVWEPNNVKLGPGYYDCRLVSNYAGLPLYVATCCVGSSFSSSSSSRSSR